MLGQPLFMLTPQVIGCRLSGRLKEGVTADLVLTITQLLRKKGVVDKFVEFYGPGLAHLPLADRATIANMAPSTAPPVAFSPSTSTPSITYAPPVAPKPRPSPCARPTTKPGPVPHR